MDKVRFVSIKNGEIWEFESWSHIESLGGLKNIFPKDQYDFIYNEHACYSIYNNIQAQIVLSKKFGCKLIYILNYKITIESVADFLSPYVKAINYFANIKNQDEPIRV